MGAGTSGEERVASLVGRDAELTRIAELLGTGGRIVTLWGPPGVGKTSLALAAAAEWARTTGRPARVCYLASAARKDEVIHLVADALAAPLHVATDEVVAQLQRVLAAQGPFLLVLDNLEQVAAVAAPLLAAWLPAAPDLRIIGTSRECIGVASEVPCEIRPLAVPSADDAAWSAIEEAPAVVLFLQRLRSRMDNFRVGRGEATWIRDLVRRLDGLPLALDLAAPLVEIMGARALVERLDRGEVQLTGPTNPASSSHQSLDQALEWSWDLLTPHEQATLARCSVFERPFTIEAAEAVAQEGEEHDVAGCLRSLRSKSLLSTRRDEAGDHLCEMLTVIREFARTRLREMDEAAALERHAIFFLDRAEALARGPRDAPFFTALGAIQPELVAVHRRAGAGPSPREEDAVRALRATAALEPLLLLRGPLSLRAMLVDQALALAQEWGAPPDLIGEVLACKAGVLTSSGRRLESGEVLDRAIEIVRDQGDSRAEAIALIKRAYCHHDLRRMADAVKDMRAGVAIAERLGDAIARGEGWLLEASLHFAEDRMSEAMDACRAGLDHARAHGNRSLEARLLGHLALFAGEADQDDYLRHAEDAIAISRELGDRFHEGLVLLNRGAHARQRGSFVDARATLDQALELWQSMGDVRRIALSEAGLGAIDLAEGNVRAGRERFERACAVFAAGESPHWSAALLLGTLGVGYSMEGRHTDAEAAFERSRRALAGIQRADIRDATLLLHAHAALAAVEGALASGTAEEARAFADAFARIVAERRPPGRAARSEVRFSLLLLHQRIEASPALRGIVGSGAPGGPVLRDLDARELVVSASGDRFRLAPHQPVSLARRAPLRRLLVALVEHAQSAPGAALDVDTMVARTWPGESIQPKAAHNRIQVALTTLRQLGLNEVLRRGPSGYYLDPSFSVVIGSPGGDPA